VAVETLVHEYRDHAPQRSVDDLVEVEVGQDAAARRFEELQRAARVEVLLCVAPPYVVPLQDNGLQVERLAAGVSYRVIYDRCALEAAGAVDHVRRCVAAGEEARALSGVPMKLAIADRSLALVPRHNGRPSLDAGHVLVHESALLDALVTLFEALWAQATPLQVDVSGELSELEERLSADDAALLSLFLSGLTDQAIANQLGLSLRTVQRRVRRLMDAAGATTRIQLGWQASRRGWLAADLR
jgi:DNA-binding CsgD family transcriptional regulator